jgi:hypothetical protein
MKPTGKQQILFFSHIITCAIWSLLPHTSGLTPLIAFAIASAWYIQNPLLRALITLIPAIIHDSITGGHSTQLWVYATLVITSLYSRTTPNPLSVLGTSLYGFISFFICTNLGVFLTTTLYPRSFIGLAQCYYAAIPFVYTTACSTIGLSFLLYSIHAVTVYLTQHSQSSMVNETHQ